MNEWKELKKDKLPEDILTGAYEFEKECDTRHKIFAPLNWKAIEILRDLDKWETRYRYRKPEPKAPTHEEIMTKWCKVQDYIGERPKWERVARYSDGIYFFSYNDRPLLKRDFIGKALKDIPPEN